MKTAKIIVCCHKQDVMATEPPYLPIQVGKAISNVDLGIQGDDEGENISSKNRSYCELTGMYWAWKNLKGVDVIGLCHYRRYFDFHNQCEKVLPETCFSAAEFSKLDLSIPQSVIDNLQNGEAYIVKPRIYKSSLFLDYCYNHISEDINLLKQYIYDTQPEDICRAWHKYMHCNNELNHYNMFLMTWHDFDAYCSWLFPLLEEMEKRIDISHYSANQGRIWGYMAERLLGVWLLAKHFRLHEKSLIWVNNSIPRGSRSYIMYYFQYFVKKSFII